MNNPDPIKANKTHGLSTSQQYRAWMNMKARCDNPNFIEYQHYGGRGITYDPKWKTFVGFWKDMEEGYQPNLSLERKDVNANYSKENCRWIPRGHQQRNKRNSRLVTYKGETLCLSEWAERVGLKVHTLYRRIAIVGWPIEEALTTKVGISYGRQGKNAH